MNRFDHLHEDWRATPIHHEEGPWTPHPDVTVTIVCAANRTDEGDIFLGARHFDLRMRQQARLAGVDLLGSEEGFIDQFGRFWNRRQAAEICRIEGRRINVERQGGRGDILFSEGLY